MTLDLSKPIIWTVRGNVNEDELSLSVHWEENEDTATMVETYTFKADGELARQSKHVFARKGLDMSGLMANLT